MRRTSSAPRRLFELTAELQGHQIKNKDLLAASGAISLRGNEGFESLAEDEAAVQMQSQAHAPNIDIQQRWVYQSHHVGMLCTSS